MFCGPWGPRGRVRGRLGTRQGTSDRKHGRRVRREVPESDQLLLKTSPIRGFAGRGAPEEEESTGGPGEPRSPFRSRSGPHSKVSTVFPEVTGG